MANSTSPSAPNSRADLRTAVAGDDRLAQVDRALQLLDHRSVDGRCLAGAGLARLLGQALHGDDLRIAGRRLRRIDRGDSAARATWQRRDKHQRQRQEALDLVHHGGHVQRLSHRRVAFARSAGEVGRAGVRGLSELRLLLSQLLVRLELLDQSPVLLGSLDPRHSVPVEKHPDKKTKAWAEQLLDRSRRLFSAWHRRDEMTAEGFHRSMLTHRDRFLELVRKPPSTKEAKNLAARFANVEYTNNESLFGYK